MVAADDLRSQVAMTAPPRLTLTPALLCMGCRLCARRCSLGLYSAVVQPLLLSKPYTSLEWNTLCVVYSARCSPGSLATTRRPWMRCWMQCMSVQNTGPISSAPAKSERK